MKLFSNDFKKEIDKRLAKLLQIMNSSRTEALLVNANVNVYYLSGRFYRGYVYVSAFDPPIWFIVKPEIFDDSEDICYIRKPELISEILSKRGYSIPKTIGLEFDDLSYTDIIRLKNIFSGSEAINGSRLLRQARMIKTEWEINQMITDGFHHSRVYSKIKDCFKKGMSDLQFQIEIERQLRLEGSLGVSRVAGNLMEINLGSVISGENADTPSPYEFTMGGAGTDSSLPVGADNSEIKSGTTVMIDMNGGFNGYQTDMTRVWCLGEVSDLAQKAHSCSIRILRTLEKTALPGVNVSTLYNKAFEIVKEMDLLDYFMGHRSKVSFIGHGIGIELNELPVINAKSKDILATNMTIAIEPKFVIPSIGAVGIENTYRVTPVGLENLTVFPEKIQEL